MPLYQKSWWKKTFGAEEKRKKENTLTNLAAVMEFCKEAKNDLLALKPLLERLEELEKERQVAAHAIVHVNLERQAELIDKIIERYEFFQSDVDIQGLRIKQIAQEFLHHAEKAGMKDLIREKQKNPKWLFQW